MKLVLLCSGKNIDRRCKGVVCNQYCRPSKGLDLVLRVFCCRCILFKRSGPCATAGMIRPHVCGLVKNHVLVSPFGTLRHLENSRNCCVT